MSTLPLSALIAGPIWILACVVWLVLAARNLSPRTVSGSDGYRGEPTWSKYRYPSLLLIALAPVVSAVQYIATGHLYFWAGACVLFPGLLVIALHLLLARRWASRASRPAAAAFREKSIVVQSVSILAVYGFFGVRLWGFWDQPSLSSAAASAIMVFALVGITICMLIIVIASHVALAFYARPETLDERDRVIGLRGSRNAYVVLTVGIWCVLYLAIAGVPHGALLYAIMAAFALAELVRLGSQLLYYRLGA
jgi:hypothetical protein